MANEIRENDKGLTLQRILLAAHDEFSAKGLDGANIEHIARAANVTKQLIHHYFKTKDQLYKTTLESIADDMEILKDVDQYHTLGASEAMTLIVDRFIEEHIKNPSYAALTLDQGLHHGAHITKQNRFIANMQFVIEKIVGPVIERGIATGEFRAGLNATLVHWLIFHVASGFFLNGEIMSQTMDVNLTREEGISIWRNAAVDFVLNALRKN